MSDGININNDITGDYENISEEVNIDLNEDYKINWDAPTQEEDAIQVEETAEVPLGEPTESGEEVADEVRESEDGEHEDEVHEEEGAVELGQVWEDDDEEEEGDYHEDEEYEDNDEEEAPSLGEEWDALFDFIDENPGASPEDYFNLKTLGEGMDESDKLKLHLANKHGLDVEDDAEEIDFLYDDTFGYDEDLDSERDIRLKKIERKKSLKEADAEIEELKSQYGGDLKFNNQPEEVQNALNFYEEQQEVIQQNEQLAEDFQARTQDFFTKEFKGFEFDYGDGRTQRIKAGNSQKVAQDQSDISNFINKFVGEDGQINDLQGYHKSLWAANNADALFSHAYEQGKADAVRSARKTAKNIDMDPRQDSSAEQVTQQGRFKLLDNDEDDFKFSF